jgi:site-specific recombinase XerD
VCTSGDQHRQVRAGIERPIQLGLAPRVQRCHCRLQKLGVKAEADLVDVPGAETQKGKRDRAIPSALLYHGLRREELCTLKVRDIPPRRGVLHLHGKGGKVRGVRLH